MRWLVPASALALSGCAAPFADLQSARTVPKGTLELTPGYSSVSASADGGTALLQREYTVQLGAGTGERSDWRFRFTRMDFGKGEGLNVIGLGPKFAVQPDRVAVATPVGFAVGQGMDVTETIQIHPTRLFTFPAAETMEINVRQDAHSDPRRQHARAGREPRRCDRPGHSTLGDPA